MERSIIKVGRRWVIVETHHDRNQTTVEMSPEAKRITGAHTVARKGTSDATARSVARDGNALRYPTLRAAAAAMMEADHDAQ